MPSIARDSLAEGPSIGYGSRAAEVSLPTFVQHARVPELHIGDGSED